MLLGSVFFHFVAQLGRQLPGNIAEKILFMMLAPAVDDLRVDIAVQVKFEIADHLGILLGRVGHFLSLIRLKHFRIKIDLQKTAQRFQLVLGIE